MNRLKCHNSRTDAFTFTVAVMFFITLSVPVRAVGAAESKPSYPSFLVIVADDLGWGDVGWHGSKLKTPHLDRLVREGVELDQHYVAPMCTPTRVALLTGRYASRFGVTAAQSARALPWNTMTLARALKNSGYDTALVGKWHLGSKPEWGPQKFGFDFAYGSLGGATGLYDHRYQKGPFTDTWHRDGKLVREEGHVTDLLASEAVRWLDQRGVKPFFLYLAFTVPHAPIREPEKWVSLYPDIEPLSRRHYAASVSHLDDAVGQVMRALDRHGKREQTAIVFFSDNGAVPNVRNDDPQYHPDDYPPGPAGGSNEPLHGQKGQLYEGGIRVPAFIDWPGKLKPGKFSAPMHVADWMPTLCGLAGFQTTADLKWDGRDLWPALTGAALPSPRQFYWVGANFATSAVRDGDWKLVLTEKSKGRPELFNLAADPFEKTNQAQNEPARVAALTALLGKLSARDRDAQVDPAGDRTDK